MQSIKSIFEVFIKQKIEMKFVLFSIGQTLVQDFLMELVLLLFLAKLAHTLQNILPNKCELYVCWFLYFFVDPIKCWKCFHELKIFLTPLPPYKWLHNIWMVPCQIFQSLHLLSALRLFQTLEYKDKYSHSTISIFILLISPSRLKEFRRHCMELGLSVNDILVCVFSCFFFFF